MPRLSDGELSRHPRKGFRVSVGYYEKDGKKTPKVFWLGHNKERAHFLAHTWRTSWLQLKANVAQPAFYWWP